MDRRRQGNADDEGNRRAWVTGAAVLAGLAGLAGGLYYLSRKSEEGAGDSAQAQGHHGEGRTPHPRRTGHGIRSISNGYDSDTGSDDDYGPTTTQYQGSRVENIPENPPISNLDSLVEAIYVRYVSIKADEFKLYYRILTDVFYHLHRTMKQVDQYYERYSSVIEFAGSHYDGARIEKPDEFDLDIVIRMPINYSLDPYSPSDSDINFKPQEAGFVELKTGRQFKNLPNRDPGDWEINKTAYKWKDSEDYLSRAKFLDWFKGLVARALNTFEKNRRNQRVREIDGLDYTIRTSEAGPAITLIIEQELTGFKLDFDLVPALRFPESRWPIDVDHREIPAGCEKEFWMVVPKPNKSDPNDKVKMARSWRFALQSQERQLFYNCYNLKQALRLMKKLRDAQGMKKIASYYIKTLFYWEVLARQSEPNFWRNSSGKLFTIMVHRLHDAVCSGNITYFWNSDDNLLKHVKRTVLDRYEKILKDLMLVLADSTKYREVAKFLLTPAEYSEFKNKIPCSQDTAWTYLS